MPKAPNVPPLNLTNNTRKDVPQSPVVGASSARSTESPQSPRSPPLSPALPSQPIALDMQIRDNGPTSPRIGGLPDAPSSPSKSSPKQHSRDASKSFFSNLMASKSSHKLQSQFPDPSTIETSDRSQGRSRGNSKDRSLYSIRKQNSTPDLPRLMTANGHSQDGNEQPITSADSVISKQKSKSKLGGILTRSRSGRPEEDKKHKQRPATGLNVEIHAPSPESPHDHFAAPLKTAPIKQSPRDTEHNFEGSTNRNRSADRSGQEEPRRTESRHNGHYATTANTPRDGNSLFANIQQTGRGVGHTLGKAGRGLFSKMTRSGSTNERELVPDENYVCTTINLPLVKQTRVTRIAKKLELSKDKTEFWMPALPWRCIDYLNMQCEQEGLYRVPGSGKEVKKWQRRFDTEYDINLFDEPELYDVNTIASMFKAWLRDLPDELFPKAIQAKISKQCHGAQQTPQLLKDELSKLPPFNYYLLFAITCHLSLLHSYADQNKMDYRNLCICFQPCLKIDAFCFQFLVMDWKECWQQGCWTEKEYLQEELRHEKEGSIKEPDQTESASEERTLSSSNSSAQLPQSQPVPQLPPRSADGLRSRTPPNPTKDVSSSVGRSRTPPIATRDVNQNGQPVTNGRSQPPLRPKQRSLSSNGRETIRTPSHGHARTAPAVPRLVTRTPEQQSITDSKLPELGSMSPIRM